MSATYDETLPTDTDRARSLLGDTLVAPESRALHSDEHIAAVLDQRGGLAAGVAWLAQELVTRFSQQPVRIADDGSAIDFSARIPAWQALASGGATAIVSAPAATSADPPAISAAVCTVAGW